MSAPAGACLPRASSSAKLLELKWLEPEVVSPAQTAYKLDNGSPEMKNLPIASANTIPINPQ